MIARLKQDSNVRFITISCSSIFRQELSNKWPGQKREHWVLKAGWTVRREHDNNSSGIIREVDLYMHLDTCFIFFPQVTWSFDGGPEPTEWVSIECISVFPRDFFLIKFVCALCLNCITVKMTRQWGWQWHGVKIPGKTVQRVGVKSRGYKAMGRKGGR